VKLLSFIQAFPNKPGEYQMPPTTKEDMPATKTASQLIVLKSIIIDFGVYVYSNLFPNFYQLNTNCIKLEKQVTKTNNQPTKKSLSRERLNDIGFRAILIPAFGIAIPIVTGMTHGISLTAWQFKLSYLYTVGIAFFIWEGNRYLLFTLRSYFDWFNKPLRKITALVLAISFYTIPVSALLLVIWYHIFNEGKVNWNVITTSTLIIMVCVVFITHVYETVFLVREAETEKVKKEQLERARVEAELEALKSQIDPHFIFNSLNTLSHLIEETPSKAKLFNDSLADVYRYILQNKGRELVLLREEMGFLQDFFSLLRIRFGQAIQLHPDVNENLFDHYLIPPISLQILLENAIKHNEFSDAEPLVINISMNDMNELIFHNHVRRKILRKGSSRIGLNNLSERYKLTTNKEITVRQEDDEFSVSLPVLEIV
jgi:sensor histidine kinase YesM